MHAYNRVIFYFQSRPKSAYRCLQCSIVLCVCMHQPRTVNKPKMCVRVPIKSVCEYLLRALNACVVFPWRLFRAAAWCMYVCICSHTYVHECRIHTYIHEVDTSTSSGIYSILHIVTYSSVYHAYLCIFVYKVFLHTCTFHVRMYVCMYGHPYVRHTYEHKICTHSISIKNWHIYIHVYIYIYTYSRTHFYARVCMHAHVCVYICMHIYAHVSAYICMQKAFLQC